jgi:hypothetical protein
LERECQAIKKKRQEAENAIKCKGQNYHVSPIYIAINDNTIENTYKKIEQLGVSNG